MERPWRLSEGPTRGTELGEPADPDDFTHDAVAVSPAGVAVAILRRVKGAAKPVIVFEPARASA